MSEPPVVRSAEHEVYRNDYVVVHDDAVVRADGTEGTYVRIGSPNAGLGVVVVAVHAGRLGLVKTYRYPVAAWQWGFVRGFAHGEDVLATAGAELGEELGVVATDLTVIGHLTPDSGLLSTRVAVVVADVADPDGRPADTAEVHGTAWVTPTELEQRISSGEIEDAFTMAALVLATARGVLGR